MVKCDTSINEFEFMNCKCWFLAVICVCTMLYMNGFQMFTVFSLRTFVTKFRLTHLKSVKGIRKQKSISTAIEMVHFKLELCSCELLSFRRCFWIRRVAQFESVTTRLFRSNGRYKLQCSLFIYRFSVMLNSSKIKAQFNLKETCAREYLVNSREYLLKKWTFSLNLSLFKKKKMFNLKWMIEFWNIRFRKENRVTRILWVCVDTNSILFITFVCYGLRWCLLIWVCVHFHNLVLYMKYIEYCFATIEFDYFNWLSVSVW